MSVSVHVPLSAGYLAPEGTMFSPEGRCRPFDAAARGTLPGDGCALVALRRLSDAIADGDNIRAIIRATAINNDGLPQAAQTATQVSPRSYFVSLSELPQGVNIAFHPLRCSAEKLDFYACASASDASPTDS